LIKTHILFFSFLSAAGKHGINNAAERSSEFYEGRFFVHLFAQAGE